MKPVKYSIGVRLDMQSINSLAEIAKRRRIKKTALIRQAVELFLAANIEPPAAA